MFNDIFFELKAKMKQNIFLKNILLLSSGTMLAQALGIIALPIITRIYTPSEYGSLTIYTTLILIFSIGSFYLELAIPIASNKKEAKKIVQVSFFILLFYTFLLTIFTISLPDKLKLQIYDHGNFHFFFFLVIVGVFCTGFYSIARQWSLREQDYSALSKASIIQSLNGNFSKIFLGTVGLSTFGLVIGNIISVSSGSFKLLKSFFKGDIYKVNYHDFFSLLKRYKDFPLYQTPSMLLTRLGQQSPIIFLTSFYGVEMAGFYGLASSIIMLPMILIGDSISDVYYSEAAKIIKKDSYKLKELSINLFRKTFLFALPISLFFLVFSPIFFSIVFGEKWTESGDFARMLSLYLFCRMVFAPIGKICIILEKQRQIMMVNVLTTLVVVLMFYVSFKLNISAQTSILFYSLVMSSSFFITFIYGFKLINYKTKNK